MNLLPLELLREMEEMSSSPNCRFGRPRGLPDAVEGFAVWTPAVDVEESDREYLVKADLPDVNRHDVRVSIDDGVLSVDGERTRDASQNTKKYHRLERTYGRFVRRLTLPGDVDAAAVVAEFRHGVLHVHLPKAASPRSRSVTVEVK